MKYDILADWMLNAYCNFSCPYCFFVNDKRLKNKKYKGHENIRLIADFFDNSRLIWLIHMSGGEPFIHPKFVELCQNLTKKHYISINSNLTLNTVYEFIENVNPKRVSFINGSLHYRQRLENHSIKLFIDKYHKFKKADFKIFVTQVFYPPIIHEFEQIFKNFKEQGIIIRPKVFRGFFDNKLYPDGYTQKERMIFIKYSKMADLIEPLSSIHIDPNLDRQFLSGNLTFKGIKCNAGKKFVYIKYNGDIVRCHAGSIPLGNIFDGRLKLHKKTRKCPFIICPCPYYGLQFTKDAAKYPV